MTKRERIEALEKRLDALEREIASIPRWTWTQPAVMSPFKIGDGLADVQPIVSPTITWTTGGATGSGGTQ